jgi:hypothetical protein
MPEFAASRGTHAVPPYLDHRRRSIGWVLFLDDAARTRHF